MAVLTKNTDIKINDIQRLREVFAAKPNPSKSAYDRIAKAKMSPIYKGRS